MKELRLKRKRIVWDVSEEEHSQFLAALAINHDKVAWFLYRCMKAYLGKEKDVIEALIDKYRDKGDNNLWKEKKENLII